METPARMPYVGDLVYTSFSGSHQDAIKKGFEARRKKIEETGDDTWDLPYLPIDPADLGRTYEAVVRVNSQSGKGGVAYLLSTTKNLDLPRRLQIELSQIVKNHTDASGGEVTADELWHIFADEYLPASEVDGLEPWGMYALKGTSLTTDEDARSHLTVTISVSGEDREITTSGNGPIDAFVAAIEQLGHRIHVLDYAEHALSKGPGRERPQPLSRPKSMTRFSGASVSTRRP